MQKCSHSHACAHHLYLYIYTFTTDPPQPLLPCVHCVQLRNKFYRQVVKIETDVQVSAVSIWFLQSIFMVRKPSAFILPTSQKHAHRIESCMCPWAFVGPSLLESAQKAVGMKSFQLAYFSEPMLRYDLAAVSFRLTKDLFQKLCAEWGFRYLGPRVYIRFTTGNRCFPVSWLLSRC